MEAVDVTNVAVAPLERLWLCRLSKGPKQHRHVQVAQGEAHHGSAGGHAYRGVGQPAGVIDQVAVAAVIPTEQERTEQYG